MEIGHRNEFLWKLGTEMSFYGNWAQKLVYKEIGHRNELLWKLGTEMSL